MNDFDKSFKKSQKLFVLWFAFCAALSVSSIGFVIWVIVKLLQHFGVV